MRWMWFILLLWPALAAAQSRTVLPHELQLEVSVEDTGSTPLTQEMVLLTIRGTYQRHITRESLIQPDLEGFNWSQMGPDTWREERLNGKKVKTFIRRMAVYPDRAGELTVGPFRHRLTLTDEGDDWFEHEIQSKPITIKVDPSPQTTGWWFPVRNLQISDEWSNAPDQLQPGEGVLRVIRIEALGATPEMIPPMPDLTSPSAMIFPHPEKRLVELTPSGPLTYAFWRWTIRPSNDVSTIVEPLTIDYFDTTTREMRTVNISAQRVAYGEREIAAPFVATGEESSLREAVLPGFPSIAAAVVMFCLAVIVGMRGRVWTGMPRLPGWDPKLRALRRAARRGQTGELRQSLVALSRSGPCAAEYRAKLVELDALVFSGKASSADLKQFVR